MSGLSRADSQRAGSAPISLFPNAWGVAAALLLCTIPFGWIGVLAPLIWLMLCVIESSSGWQRRVAFLATALLMLTAAMGLVPGSERIELLAPYTDAVGNNIQVAFNPGKAVIALALLPLLIRPKHWPARGDIRIIAAAVLLPLICAALVAGFSVKFAPVIVAAALVNFAVVCISEEGFFRWILQRGMEESLGRWRWVAVPVVVVIFTALHTGWAATPAVLALVAIAGTSYAMLWHLRGNIWACVLAHWGVNTLHMFLLPYPLTLG
ncbi:CPBP family intramembrane glutamic endopeptidase [Microbulbifer hainanensis]|uniref:CPBP family intramembrane glutamic endopeptidase n=1 Tax=Microbulbifer hainanensis TaxID=2735675 RepID=UPI0018671691|nr:CPBP family intramembrane glutamic endopeptidase [Microbulbifer hainanensis]